MDERRKRSYIMPFCHFITSMHTLKQITRRSIPDSIKHDLLRLLNIEILFFRVPLVLMLNFDRSLHEN